MAQSDRPGLDGRQRDQNGQIRAKNGATRLDTLRDIYGDNFAAGRRGDMKLDNYIADEGYDSLTHAVRDQQR